MINKVFSVYDSKAEMYLRPFLARSKGEALRGFSDASNDKTLEIGKHPEDYTLFYIAEFDESTGKYNNVLTPESLGVALEFVNVEEKVENRIKNIKEVVK